MIKNFVTFLAVLLAPCVMAGEPGYLTFVTDDGAEASISTEGLEMTFSDGNLIAVSADGHLTLPAATLASMRFTDTPAASLTLTEADANTSPLEVFTIEGRCLGPFESWTEMAASLPKATYIIRHNDITIKASL